MKEQKPTEERSSEEVNHYVFTHFVSTHKRVKQKTKLATVKDFEVLPLKGLLDDNIFQSVKLFLWFSQN